MTLENPVYYSGHAPLRSRGTIFRDGGDGRWGWEVGLPRVHKRSPESRSWARPRRPAELGEHPGPLRVLRGHSGRPAPHAASSPGSTRGGCSAPAAGQGASGKGAVRRRKDLCVAGAHTPLARENASAPRLGSSSRAWREPRLRKGRDREPTPGAGEDSGPEAPGRVSAPRPAAPLPSPRPGGARGSSRFGETCCSRVRPAGFGWAGAPPSARRGPRLPPEALRRTKPFPQGSGEGASLPPRLGPRED